MKIKFKNVLALLLVVCMMATLFAACGDKKESEVTPSASAPVSQAPSDSGDDDDDEEIITINVWLPELGNTGSGAKWEVVEAALNELTETEIGIHVNYTWLPLTDVGTQFTLAMSNKEAIDVVGVTPIAACSFLAFFTNGMLMDISPYIEENAPDVKAALDEFNILDSVTINGGIYAIPTFRQLNSNLYLIARKDVLEEVGMLDKFSTMTTWAEYEEVMEVIKSEAGMYPTGGGNRNMGFGSSGFYGGTYLKDAYMWDRLGDNTGLIYTDQAGNVSLSYAREDIIDTCKMMADWDKKGYIYPDTPFTKDLPEEFCRQKVFAAYVVNSEYGVEVNKSQTIGTDMICLEIAPGMVSTSAASGFGAAIPNTSKNPEAALRYLNFAHTSEEYMNMINWGVDGETYEMNSDGEADYIDGADTSTSGYHYADFMFGNQFLASPWAGSGGADFRERAFDNFAAAPVSIYMGLSVDVGDMSTLIAALMSVKDEFAPQLTCGMYTDAMHAEFLAKLESAGIQDYLDFYQSSVDEFLK